MHMVLEQEEPGKTSLHPYVPMKSIWWKIPMLIWKQSIGTS